MGIERVEGLPSVQPAAGASGEGPAGSVVPPAAPAEPDPLAPSGGDEDETEEVFKLAADGSYLGKLPDGRPFRLVRPNVATQFLMDEIVGGSETLKNNARTLVMVKSLMYLDTLDGEKVSRPTDRPTAQKIMNKLGDEGTDYITNCYLNLYVLAKDQLPKSVRQ